MTLYAFPIPHRMRCGWTATARTMPAARFLPVNLREENEAFVLTAFVPGLEAERLHIKVLGDLISLEGEFPLDEHEYLVQELPGGPFRRQLRLPAPVDADRVEATISKGILTLRLPRAESARPKTINVSTHEP